MIPFRKFVSTLELKIIKLSFNFSIDNWPCVKHSWCSVFTW